MTPSGITRRPSRHGEDEAGLLALFRAVADHDGGGVVVLPDRVRAEYVDDEPTTVRDHLVWESGGQLVAVSALWRETTDAEARAYAHLDVHPAFRDTALEDEVAQALRSSAVSLIGGPVAVRLNAREHQLWKTAMLDRNGYVADRLFHRLSRDLTRAIPEPVVPDGYAVRPLAGEAELPAWHATFDAAFAGHYDTPRYGPEERRHKMTLSDYLPAGDLVAVAPDGAVAGFAWSFREQPESGSARGNINYVGVRSEHRRRGVARALLLTALGTLRGLGLDTVVLAVDSGNETNALRLYESMGFVKLNVSIVYLAQIA